ncbi:RagB/SusD family nutrient uptake outer membrane protein [Kaistella flava (ex Peng et al. 2021)]|uniref:RagB/SusD family nutrient uptake outer membrane protein n=1 Tax=Kaistella flava (ex Peng et al. 2021) TaxID=2038776 RepID=A0A7M2Y3P2_9FLAO|nr:RagB/SusD family nutrient uptake outer membrane protein [Kaistella flava (ex Peng et al. 2021)]QOW08848.1 RagB/SusD family nutrient uptake outer membrane protein [Kaistella flava (ex Peng et al. 2021)]
MKNFRIKNISIAVAIFGASLTMTSCINDLRQEPITEVTAASLYKDFGNYKNLLAKVYGGLAVGGQTGGDGNGDIADIDGGFSNYMRLLYTLQEITTDEAVIGWNDGTLPEFHKMTWTPTNEFNNAMYYRIYTEIAFCNEFIKNTTDEMLSSNGISGTNADEAKVMRAEVRFIRAQAYYHLLDLYGNVPFVDETTFGTLPKQISRAELFTYVENQLKAAESELKAPKANEYGRVDKAAAWSLLARLYLNAKVYTGTDRNADVIANTEKVISAGYTLNPTYENLFLADNNLNNPENIFSIVYDGLKTQTNGGTTFMVHAAIGGTMDPAAFGVNGGWGGLRTTKAFVNKFEPSDVRGRFYTSGQTLDINDLGNFNDGYAFIKYKNITSTGAAGAHDNWVETDMPVYRLADTYLMYAEAVLRGGGGSMSTAVGYINALRTRANASPVTFIDLNFILDERSRELSWENTRRTDLIRFGKFTSATYLWPWKGNAKDGIAVAEYRNLFPIPNNDLVVNKNLVQNPGY